MTTTTGIPREQLRDRVRLYLQVMLVIDLAAYASDLLTPLIIDAVEPVRLPYPFAYLRWSVTGFLATVWVAVKLLSLGRWVLVAIESSVTVGLALVYGYLSVAFASEDATATGPAFAVIGVVLLLVVRSALVPSPVLQTALVGLASFGCALAAAWEPFGALDPVTRDGLSFMSFAFIIATSTTSYVIYGLRRQVRDAMRLGQYELGRKLGQGGMGVVYEATHLMLRRPTAVKLLPTDAAAAQAVARFEREVQQTSRLEHPNNVSIFDYGRTPDGQFYYAMEYLDGLTLQELVAEVGPLPEARAVRILSQAAHALAEAHGLGLVHRDIKPSNIMLTDRGRIPDTVKVLDFGLVKVTDDPSAEGDADLTHESAVLGTPQYMAPEAITAPERVGPASDVYALGAVAFFLLTGRHVFSGKSVIEVCSKHLEATPDSPSAVRGRPLDPDLEALVLRCLEKDPAKRPSDGAALAEAVDELQPSGWTLADARAWWSDFESRREASRDLASPEPTQLAIDVEGR